jgi:DNA-binding phage protein
MESLFSNLNPTLKTVLVIAAAAGIVLGAVNSYHQWQLAKLRIEKEKQS